MREEKKPMCANVCEKIPLLHILALISCIASDVVETQNFLARSGEILNFQISTFRA